MRLAVLLIQAVTTAAVRGTVSPGDAHVRIVNASTGYVVEADARDGGFLVAGLDIGGPYTVEVRRIGFAPQVQRDIFLSLGERLELTFKLGTVTTTLAPVRVLETSRLSGAGATISDTLVHRLPTLNRDMYDFVRLAPELSTKVKLPNGGISAAGENLRFNNYLIDGAPDRFASGNSPLALGGGKSVPLDAVQEYEVLVAPFDVRYGDFAGAMMNAVTKAGTNELHGTGFVYGRNERLARPSDFTRSAPYDREQFGFALGGPIVRDHLHFFVAPELQRLASPAAGPYVGQPSDASSILRVAPADVARFTSLLDRVGIPSGSAGQVATGNPLANLFARLDLAMPEWNSRLVLIENYARTSTIAFSRANPDTFALSSYRVTTSNVSPLTSLQVRTTAKSGAFNELIASVRTTRTTAKPDVRASLVQVVVPSPTGGRTILEAGSSEAAQGGSMGTREVVATDNLTLPVTEAHELTLGIQAGLFRLDAEALSIPYGRWSFESLDSLERGVAARYEVGQGFGASTVTLRGTQLAAYVADEWRVSPRVRLTLGVRGDLLRFLDHAPYNQVVDSIFHRRTDEIPSARPRLSPRVGARWDLFGGGRDVVQAGIGVFTGRYPPLYAQTAVSSYGVGTGVLSCGTLSTDLGPPPAFAPDYRSPPRTCANGAALAGAPKGDVDLLQRNLRPAQTVRGSVAYERRLPWDVVSTSEVLITRATSDFVFNNLNLAGPQAVDSHGRVLYGSISASGQAAPALRSSFSEVIDIASTSANHSFQISSRLEKRFGERVAGTASYTFTRVRDVEMPIRAGMRGTVNWSNARAVSGRHDDLSTEISANDLPHRVVLAGTYRAPWRGRTMVSLYYVGESGSPFTYVSGGVLGRGDLNADGAVGNDPIYVPRSAFDTSEIRFTGVSSASGADTTAAAQRARIATQQAAFEQFIARTPCLRRQRGTILRANSCREPWSHTSIATVSQSLFAARGRSLDLQLDAYNLLNLLNAAWGQYRVAAPALLQQVGETPGPPSVAQPIFRFDATRPAWTIMPVESAYQLQLSLRYRF